MSGNSDVVEAGAMVAPSIMSQNQIDFTRDMEVEADAIGIKTLGLAGYDPYAMSDFFEKLSTGSDPRNAQSTEFLRTHPLIMLIGNILDEILPVINCIINHGKNNIFNKK